MVPLDSHSERDLKFSNFPVADFSSLMISHRGITVVNDVSQTDQARPIEKCGIRAFMVAPIVFEDDGVFGYLCCVDDVPRVYTEHEIYLLDWTAGLISYVIEVEQASVVDPLTGAMNRAFLQRFFTGMKHDFGTHFAVVFVDLDNFKSINDQYGHQVGDAILGLVVQRLKRRIRIDDVIIRTGGDEFIVILGSMKNSEEIIGEAAARLLHALERDYTIANQSIKLSASLGVSLCPLHGNDLKSLIDAADRAMYCMKSNGGHGFKFCKLSDESDH